jgi:MSHA pilin protein MshD
MKRRAARGLSLIEVVVAITILGIASTTILGLLSHIALRSSEVMLAHQASNIAAAYLNEIVSKPFGNGVVCGGPRPLRDEVCDYNGLDEMGARDRTDTLIAGLGAYRVRVAVNLTAIGGPPAAPARLIIVTVNDPMGQQTILSTYKVAP